MTDHDRKDGMAAQRKSTLLTIEAMEQSCASFGGVFAGYLVEQQHLPLGRVQQLLADRLGVRLARGTWVSWVQQAAQLLEPVEQQIKTALRQAAVLHHDETGVRRGGRLAWAHVADM